MANVIALIDAQIAALVADPTTSQTLRDMLTAALNCDPLDALADAEVLTDILRARFDALTGGTTTTDAKVVDLFRRGRPPR